MYKLIGILILIASANVSAYCGGETDRFMECMQRQEQIYEQERTQREILRLQREQNQRLRDLDRSRDNEQMWNLFD